MDNIRDMGNTFPHSVRDMDNIRDMGNTFPHSVRDMDNIRDMGIHFQIPVFWTFGYTALHTLYLYIIYSEEVIITV